MHPKIPATQPTAYTGVCSGGPKDGQLHATMAGRRTPMEGGAYVWSPAPDGHHVGTWTWLADRKETTH